MASAREQHTNLEAWRRHTASGMVVTAVALGLRSAVDAAPETPAVVVEARTEPTPPPGPLDLYFDAESPSETWAVVRPALLERNRR